MNSSRPVQTNNNNNNLVVFVAALALGGYAVYTVGDLQTVIYAVCGAYVLRLLIQNPDVLAYLQDQLALLRQSGSHSQPVLVSPHSAHPSHSDTAVLPNQQQAAQPRLDLHFMEQTGYQPLRQQTQPTPLQTQQPQHHQQPHRVPTMAEYESTSPTTPIPQYTQFNVPPAPSIRLPSRTASRTSGNSDEFTSIPGRDRFGSFSQSDTGTITNGDRFNLLSAPNNFNTHASGDMTPRPGFDPRLSVVSTFSAFPEPVNNPFGSYAHYDAGTIGGERLVQRVEIPNEYTIPPNFSLSERIAAPPPRPLSSTDSDGRLSRASTTSPSTTKQKQSVEPRDEYVPKRQHRKPTVAARVGEVAAPGGGIAPPRSGSANSSSSGSSNSSRQQQQKYYQQHQRVGSPLVESPQVISPADYESDSSHASSSSARSSYETTNVMSGHGRTESLGLPTYEQHATTIFTLVPKRSGYVPQIQAILKASRQAWLSLPGSVTHEVGLDKDTGSVVVVETYESTESMNDFEQSTEREGILDRLKTFIEEPKTTVVRLPASSAATRVIR